MTDSWSAFNPQPADPWAAFNPQAAPQQQPTGTVPKPFLDRVRAGLLAEKDDSLDTTHDPMGDPGPIFASSPFEDAAARVQRKYATRPTKVPLGPYVLHGLVTGLAEGLASLPKRAMDAANELAMTGDQYDPGPAVEAALLTMGTGTKFSRTTLESMATPGKDQIIGGLPTKEHFDTAAEILSRDNPSRELSVRANLREQWEERGLHPAEVAHDAQHDAFLKREIAPIEAYHGSPHDFDAFSLDKIGSGEGAQSYGHGLYFAENKTVAHDYATKLTSIDGESLGRFTALGEQSLDISGPVYERVLKGGEPVARDELRKSTNELAYTKARNPNDTMAIGAIEREVAALQKLVDSGDYSASKGAIYQVRINADREHFLDWDKPLSEQPPEVQAALKRAGYETEVDQRGDQIARELGMTASHYDQALASQKLREAGIPGIRYLDQGSRTVDFVVPESERVPNDLTYNYVLFDDKLVEITHKNGEKVAAGADVTRPENLPTLEQQPPRPPGQLVDKARALGEQLSGLGRNIQFMLDPMATGSNRAMVIAKDTISTVRRIRWEHAQVDNEIMRRFTPEQQERMWNALDEESVLRQAEGETGLTTHGIFEREPAHENMGTATLAPEEKYFVDYIQGPSQAAWLHVRDVGIVEGEGLPAYSVRMMLNVAAAAEHGGPQALNELGRNVFTRTANMLERKHLLAEETEAAAKEMVAARMRERGATPEQIAAEIEKVKIFRNIRAVPLATARLQEAAVWREMINKIEETGRATGQDMVAVGFQPDKSWFTIAGNPAFAKWEPLKYERNPVTGAMEAMRNEAGNVVMVKKPIYMPGEFRGPMTAILDESSSKGKVVTTAQSAYGALMAIKGKSMTAILNSPLIHNEVVWSKVAEAAGGREWLGFGLYFKGNRIVSSNPTRATELIERGLDPIGRRGSYKDITAMAEEPNLKPGISWTAHIARAVPDLFSPTAGDTVGRAIDKAGNFFHNTLLWDRVGDLQFGLADHLSDRLVAKGADRLTADRIGAHFSNIIVGSIPKEAMSSGARVTANLFLFSRSFTLGNLSTFKQAALGLPKPILAQIERDFGMSAAEAVGPEASAAVLQTASSIARRKAISTVMLSAGLYYVGNALLQHAFNVAGKDSTIEEEMTGYARRYEGLMKDTTENPFELRHAISRLSPTYDNEPKKGDRVHIGYDKDGTAIYARNPTGKFGEEMVGYPTMPMEMLRRKLSPLAGGILDILENDKGFGRKIYDENDTTIGGDVATAFAVAKHLVMKHLPEGQIMAAVDLLRGEGDKTVNELRVFGPMAGFTASVGAPGGMARGEQLAAKSQFDARFSIAWPDIKKQIQRGDEEGARDALGRIGVPPTMVNGLIRNANNPAAALRGRTLQNFYQSATPEQRDRMDRARQQFAPQP